MKHLLARLYSGTIPFCAIQKQDSEEILIASGEAANYRRIHDIPRKSGSTNGSCIYDTISVVPFCQIRERGYTVHDTGEEILTIRITEQHKIDTNILIDLLPDDSTKMQQEFRYDSTEEQYRHLIRDIITKEIGNGEGANFVVPRNLQGRLENFSVAKAMTIFKSLLQHDYGTYWKFIFFNTSRFFIGSTPERHLLVKGGKVKMNPISGTFRKSRLSQKRADLKKDLLRFLSDPKEINELFMVVDEELKMMAKMCDRGGTIVGPLLKEMSQLIHSEYLLSGESNKDIFELFTDSMFAATVVGSPVENACNIIAKYSDTSRRYYGSAMMLVGRDEDGRDFLDSPITIRTAEIDRQGKMHLSIGATLVKDSVPEDEVLETKIKGHAILSSIVGETFSETQAPILPRLYNDDDIIETMVLRNQKLSNFWFFKQDCNDTAHSSSKNLRITLIHNGDDFSFMLRHMFACMGIQTSVVRFEEYDIKKDSGNITLLGPGPGNPSDMANPKIAINHRIAGELLRHKRKSLYICLGHQILCANLGFDVERKKNPLQGSQLEIDLFGSKEHVGFYNTFCPKVRETSPQYKIAVIPELEELVAIKGEHFIGFQFHPESLLTQNGYSILQDTVKYLS